MPFWCICKWSFAEWVATVGCDETVKFSCKASDICDLRETYRYSPDHPHRKWKPARDCVAERCSEQWHECRPEHEEEAGEEEEAEEEEVADELEVSGTVSPVEDLGDVENVDEIGSDMEHDEDSAEMTNGDEHLD